MSSEALQKLVRIIWSFAFECRLNYNPRITRPTYAVLLMEKKKIKNQVLEKYLVRCDPT